MTKLNDEFVSGSIVALVTPFDGAARCPDLAAWRALLDWHIESGTAGVVVAGTTGESATLAADERDALLEIAVERCAGRLAVIAGTGASSTAVALARSRHAADLGADAVLVATPSYNRPPQRGLVAHFRAVADATPVPLVLYNVPSRTAIDLAPESVVELASHPNIAAIKEAVPDMQRVREYRSAGLTVLSGDDPSALQAMQAGARGVISVAANVVPGRFARLCRQALAATVDPVTGTATPEALNDTLAALYAFLGCETNPLPVKWLLAELGWIGSACRLPLVPLDRRFHARGRELVAALELQTAREAESE